VAPVVPAGWDVHDGVSIAEELAHALRHRLLLLLVLTMILLMVHWVRVMLRMMTLLRIMTLLRRVMPLLRMVALLWMMRMMLLMILPWDVFMDLLKNFLDAVRTEEMMSWLRFWMGLLFCAVRPEKVMN